MTRSNRFRVAATLALAAVLATPLGAQQVDKPRLSIQGKPHFDGDMLLTITDPAGVGEIAWLAIGLDPVPLRELVPTGIGLWAIGTLVDVKPLAAVPASGRLDVPFNLGPEHPALIGLTLVVHGYVDPWLTNPATLPFDLPYFLAADVLDLAAPTSTVPADFGDRIAMGDLDGDGDVDLVAGAWFEKVDGVPYAGKVYVLRGPEFIDIFSLTAPAAVEQGHFGEYVGLVDVHGDGQVDLIVPEAPGLSPTAPGRLHVFWGGPDVATTPSMTVTSKGSGAEHALFGRRSAVGDFNGDGLGDIAVAVEKATIDGLANAGRIDVFFGPDLLNTTTVIEPVPAQNTWFGDRPAAGDVDGDGIDDLLVGCPRKSINGTATIGRLYAFSGGDSFELHAIIDNPLPDGPNSRFGNWVTCNDVDGDGIKDLVTSDQRDHAYIFWADDLATHHVIDRPPAWLVQPEDSGSYGYMVATGDMNGDGWKDVLVNDVFGGPLVSCPTTFGGAIFIALGPYFATHHVLSDIDPVCFSGFGWSMAVADVDADGLPELAVGRPIPGSGKVSLYQRP